MKVLLTSASFAPSYGGPAYSVRSLAQQLTLAGISTAIWAPDGSAKTATSEPRIRSGGSNEPQELTGPLETALRSFGLPDIFHDSGLWWHHNRAIAAAARRHQRPLIVSVRGMLEPAALKHRGWKKQIAWHCYQRRILSSTAALHVTSDLESENVRALNIRADVVRIPNGLLVPAVCPKRDPTAPKRVVFLGRLHPIKGLPMLLEAWARLQPSDWSLEIAGPDENGHRQELEDQVKALRLQDTVTFSGSLRGAEKRALHERASLFVLPSYSENFGIAAGEALSAGIPVIASKGTPWAALEREDCGWHVATSADGFEQGLRSAFTTPPDKLIAMGRRGHAYVARTFSWNRIAEEFVALYQTIAFQSAQAIRSSELHMPCPETQSGWSTETKP